MRYRKFAVLVFSVLLTAVVFYHYCANEWNAQMPLRAVVVSGEHREELACWKDQWNDYCFFLPSYADPAQVMIYSNTGDEIWIDEWMMTGEGLSCDRFQMNEVYGMARIGLANHYDGVLRIMHSGNVPTLYIDVPSGNMEYIHKKKGNEETGSMRLYTVDGELAVHGDLESIKGRGNATWGWWKKSYSLTLSQETDLLDMGQAQRWILLANGYDASNLKNKVSYDLAKAAGMAYSPDSRWVDLYLNGEYAGVYLLCERNEVHPERVDIPSENGFLVSREGKGRLVRQNYPFIDLRLGAFRIHHSSMDQDQMKAMWQSVENAIVAEDGIDPQTGKHWTELIDLDSWAEKYLIDEIAANHDGGCISQYFYYDGEDPSGKIYAGPVWDMDITFGADFWQIAPPNNFVARRPGDLDHTEYFPFYFLYQKDEFYQRVVEIYRDRFRPLLVELVESGLDDYNRQISPALAANEIRWLTAGAADGKDKIKAFLAERIAFLDSLWIYEEERCDVLLLKDNGVFANHVSAWFSLRPGDCLPEIPVDLGDWYVFGSDEPFDVTQPIYESVNLYLKEKPAPQVPVDLTAETITLTVLLTVLIGMVVIDQIKTAKSRMQSRKHL